MNILNRFTSASKIISGHVVHGDKTGRQLGFPTANLELDHGKQWNDKLKPGVYTCVSYIPGMNYDGEGMIVSEKNVYAECIKPKLKLPVRKVDGLYKSKSKVKNYFPYPGLLHFGPRSTFGETDMQWEVFLLDFDYDIYDMKMIVHIGDMIRPSKKFNSVPELVKQMEQDVRDGRNLMCKKKYSKNVKTFLSF